MIQFNAYKYKCSEDHEGEVTLILKVSQTEKNKAIEIPVQQLLRVTIETEDG
jgi:hypothetical protein